LPFSHQSHTRRGNDGDVVVANISKIVNDYKRAGIGLLLVKGFVEKIGGEVCFESTDNKGSTFYFTLPVEKKSEPIKVELEESA
jgi:two-component system CheB/CheR fusion protein